MRVLTWNLFHGRSIPPAHRDLRREFAAALATWDWDVALLQEVPPWWPPLLGADDHATALTSRNCGLPLRRLVAERWPDLIKSNGGGSNAILVRRDAIVAHGRRRLRRLPERRVVQAVRLRSGVWLGNLHAQVRPAAWAEADIALAASWLLRRSGNEPVVLGGDFNVREPRPAGFAHAGGHGVDHVFVRGLRPEGVERPRRHGLSDHDPVIVTVGS
ncbi:MAG TPA: endonuclease/exonuclease/phosphatase family protein [Capillimicrobium sp.]|nr:endonuclease/exonuclease/phosphatase family protein [Capillimicrobium sp.]